MKISLLLLAILPFSAWGKDLALDCELKHNQTLIFTRSLTLKTGQKNVSVGSYDLFEVLVSSKSAQEIELQIYNAAEPSRSYATGVLKDKLSQVELSLWTREFLMEAHCRLK